MRISCNENIKILEKKTLGNGKNFQVLWLAGLTSWRRPLPKVIYRVYSIPIKILMTFFIQLDEKAITHMELQRSWITGEIRRVKEYSWRYPNACATLYQWATMPEPRWHWHKKKVDQWIHNFWQRNKNTQRKNRKSSQNGASIARYTPAEEWNLIRIFILYTSALSESKILI